MTDISTLLQLRINNQAIRALPPSMLIEEAFKKGIQPEKRSCLSKEEVQIWIAHLFKKKLTRAKAVQKARETRAKKK